MILHTVWMYWPDDDAIELEGAVDHLTCDANPDAFQAHVEAARRKVGAENVREIDFEVDWTAIGAAFDPPRLRAEVVASESQRTSQEAS